MKKVVSIISAGLLAILAVSCAKDEKVTFKTSEVTAPVIGEVNVGTDVTVNYTPAVFNMSFNQKMPVYHTLGLVKLGETVCDVTLSAAKDNGSALTISGKNLNAALQNRGLANGDVAELSLVVRATIQDPSKGVTNGYVDSEAKSISWTIKEEEKPGADPYAGWTESDWGVTGSIASAGISWDKDITMVTDGTWHVARGVVLTTTDEFKFRKYKEADPWAVNFGGDFVAFDAEFAVTQGGPNIKVTEDGTYDLLLNPDGSVAKVIPAKTGGAADPYAGWDDSDWGVTGSIASAGINWDKDITMVTDGTWHVARGVVLTTTDEFKFRKYKEADPWAVNFGGDFVAFDAEFAVTQGGPNIKVTEDGTYDLLLNPDGSVAKVIPAKTGGAADPYAGWDDSDWGVTGSIASAGINWDKDITMVTDGTWHVAKGVELTATDEFKFRMYKESDPWATNFGGDFAAFGEEFAVTQGGPNIKVTEDGTYDLLLNPDAAVAKVVKSGEDPGI